MAKERKSLTVNEKLSLIDQIKRIHPKRSYRQLSESFGIPKTTIVRLMKQENDLRTEFPVCQDISRKRKRRGKDPDVEEALLKWFTIVVKRGGIQISGSMLKEKADEIAKKLEHHGFIATDGWLSRLKKRHQIILRKANGEKKVMPIVHRDEFPTIDNELQQCCSAENEEQEEGIVEEIIEKMKQDLSDKDIEKISPSHNMSADSEYITDEAAKKCIEDLKRYFMQKGNENSPSYALDICSDYINSKSSNKQEL